MEAPEIKKKKNIYILTSYSEMSRYGDARKVINENKLAQDISWKIVGLADEAEYFFPMIAT